MDTTDSQDINLVAIWLRKDPIRWISGALAGLLSGAVTILVGMAIASHFGLESWFPVKLMATPFLGSGALEMGDHSRAILTGILFFEGLGVFFGVLFAHFTGTNKLSALLPMGVVWGIFSWIFLWNLYFQSFRTIYAARVPSGPVFPVCITFGVMMASVSLFDRLLRGRR